MNKSLKISDDSGFIGLCNSDLYQSFVNEDWELNELIERFRDEMNSGHAAIWSTGTEKVITVELRDYKSQRKSHRDVQSNLRVTNGRLWLTNYEDLSMAAQFEDEKIPSNHHSDLEFPIKNGAYQVLIRQLFDPNKHDWEILAKPIFEIVLRKIEQFEPNYFNEII